MKKFSNIPVSAAPFVRRSRHDRRGGAYPVRAFIDKILNSIRAFFEKLSRGQRIRLGILGGAIIVLAVAVSLVLGRTNYATLYTNLDAATAGEILTELDTRGVTYETQGTGAILVPAEQVDELRMQLASQGYLSGAFTYDIFGQAEGFGTTDLEKQSYLLFQTEYNVRQQLLKLDKIKDCLVKINLPGSSTFVLTRNQETASASVTLDLRSGAVLTGDEVEAIAYTVAGGTSVPVENVYIVDTNARLYTIGDESTGSTAWSAQLQMENQVRIQLETQVENLLATVFGEGKVKASVAVALNFDTENVQSVEFAPPVDGETDGLVISMSELYEYTRDAAAAGEVGTDVNGIGVPEYPYGEDGEYDYRHIAREINYEINETVTMLEKAQATIKSLSIAVLVDSEAIKVDYTENVRSLVVNAIGVGENYITVERLPFQVSSAYADAIEAQNGAQRRKEMNAIIQTAIKWVVVLLLGLAVLAFLRTLLKTGTAQQQPALVAAGGVGGTVDYVADDGEERGSALEDIDLHSKSEGVAQLEKFIDRDSTAIAQLLRNWLLDDE